MLAAECTAAASAPCIPAFLHAPRQGAAPLLPRMPARRRAHVLLARASLLPFSLGVLRRRWAVRRSPQGVLAQASGPPLWHSTRQGGAGRGVDHRNHGAPRRNQAQREGGRELESSWEWAAWAGGGCAHVGGRHEAGDATQTGGAFGREIMSSGGASQGRGSGSACSCVWGELRRATHLA